MLSFPFPTGIAVVDKHVIPEMSKDVYQRVMYYAVWEERKTVDGSFLGFIYSLRFVYIGPVGTAA